MVKISHLFLCREVGLNYALDQSVTEPTGRGAKDVKLPDNSDNPIKYIVRIREKPPRKSKMVIYHFKKEEFLKMNRINLFNDARYN